MNLYAESSAVLAWLLDEPRSREVLDLLARGESVVTSDLTLIECDRVLRRAVVLDELTEADAADRRAHLAAASTRWHLLRIAADVVERARQPFPGEPIRTLDAIHLASALLARSAIAGLRLLSLDERVRRSGKAMGFSVVPDQGSENDGTPSTTRSARQAARSSADRRPTRRSARSRHGV